MILFRCNVSPAVGVGHLTRCRTLADALTAQGINCAMAGPEQTWRVLEDERRFTSWTPLPWTDAAADAAAFIALADKIGARVAVMDDYRIDEPYQLRLKAAGLKWLQQFDASNPPPFWADFVAHGGPSETTERYRALVRNPDSQFLLGPAFAVLRPVFATLPPRNADRPVEQILLSFGGADDQGMTIRVLEGLVGTLPSSIRFRVMSGPRNPSIPAISAWLDQHARDRVCLSVDPADVASEYTTSDLAVLAGGTSTFEAAAAGVPMLLVAMADNQIRQAQGWAQRGAGHYLGRAPGIDLDLLVERVATLCEDRQLRIAMSKAGRAAVDGKGCDRIVAHLLRALKMTVEA